MFGYIIILLLLLGIIGKLFLVVRTFLLKRQEKRRLEAIENEKLERLKTHKYFFEHCLKYPLDIQQRRAIVSEAENVLVVSSAGSGKTSTIVGKVKYLTEKLHIDPRRILLISYTNKAAAELTERINKPGLRGYTFHKLALDIIGKQTNVKPSICENTDALIVQVIRELSKNKKFRKNLTSYLADYKDIESEEEKELKLDIELNHPSRQINSEELTRLWVFCQEYTSIDHISSTNQWIKKIKYFFLKWKMILGYHWDRKFFDKDIHTVIQHIPLLYLDSQEQP